MAFEGDLRDLEFGDVVQTLSMTRQHGTLVIRGPEERRVAFTERGLALLSTRRSHGERVGAYLVGTGRISAQDLDAARRATRRDSGAAIGDALLQAECVSPEDLAEARRYVAQDELFDLFRLRKGRFEFLNDDLNLTGPFAQMWFDVGGVAMEAARRIDETPRLDEIVPHDEVLTHGDPSAAPVPGEARDDLVRLYGLADGRRVVGDLLDAFHLGSFDTRKALAAMVESGALRPASAEEILSHADAVQESSRAARLLRRAVQLTPGNQDAWNRLAKALAASGDKPGAAVALCRLAQLQYGDGHGETSLTTLRSALKLHRQCPEAHDLLTRTLLALEQPEKAVSAAQEAVTECLAADAPETALEIAELALRHAPDDPRLRRGAAAACAALGRTEEAVDILDRLAHELFKARGRERECVDTYRSILALAPERGDVQEKIEAIAQREVLRKRRRRQLLAGAAGLLLVASVAVPTVFGSDVQDRLDRMNELVAANRLDDVQLLLNELREEGIGEDLLASAADALQRRIDAEKRPTLDTSIPRALVTRSEAIYDKARQQLDEGSLSGGLRTLLGAVEVVQSPDVDRIRESSPDIAQKIRDDFESEVKTALIETESRCVELGTDATRALDELQSSKALERAEYTTEPDDLEELERLAQCADEVTVVYASNDWKAIRESVPALIEATKAKPRELAPKIDAAVVNLVTSLEQAQRLGERAIAHLHRLRLLTGFRAAKDGGAALVAEGKLEEAGDVYREFLAFCREVSGAELGVTYQRIVGSYMQTFQLQEHLQGRLDDVERILARERTAADALYRGDVDTAFELRVGLAREFPQVGFASRFELPLRIESRPPGAEIVLRHDETDTALGRTTSIVSYPISGDSTIVVRLDGFEDVVLERHGAFEDATGAVVLELAKKPVWRSDPAAATETRPVVWNDRVIVAGRDGVIRALSLGDGTELARLETGLLGGFAGDPVLYRDRLLVAGVDGVGFVIEPGRLGIERRFDLPGAVRTALVATDRGVVIVDERGNVRVVDERGDDVWVRAIGTIVTDAVADDTRVAVVTLDGRLRVLSLSDGGDVCEASVPGRARWFAPTLAGGEILVSSEGGVVAALDTARARVAFEISLDTRIAGRAVVSQDVIAVPTADGRLLLRRRPADGGDAEPADVRVGPIGDGLTALADGFVATTRDGTVRRLDANGALAWRFDAGDAIGARAVRAGSRTLIVTRGGVVIALED